MVASTKWIYASTMKVKVNLCKVKKHGKSTHTCTHLTIFSYHINYLSLTDHVTYSHAVSVADEFPVKS